MDYNIDTSIKYEPLEVIDAGRLGAECLEEWWNRSLVQVNDCVLRLGVLHGEFHWHRHESEDEFFFVLDGKLLVDVGERTVELTRHQGFMVPRGVSHRTRAPERTVVMMIEAATVDPTGD